MRIGNLVVFGKRIVGGDADPLLIRWEFVSHPKLGGLYLHKLCRSDYDRALHDHPWWFYTYILKQGYGEVFEHKTEGIPHSLGKRFMWRLPGQLLFRPALWKHRVVIDGEPAWTLVLRGPTVRQWGFWPNGEFCWWRKFDSAKNICSEDVLHEDTNQ